MHISTSCKENLNLSYYYLYDNNKWQEKKNARKPLAEKSLPVVIK